MQQENSMKKTVILILSVFLILTMASCRPTVIGIPINPTPSVPGGSGNDSAGSVDSIDELKEALLDPSEKNIKLSGTIVVTESLSIGAGKSISGNGTLNLDNSATLSLEDGASLNGVTINVNEANVQGASISTFAANEPINSVINVMGNDVVIKDVKIAVPSTINGEKYNIIVVSPSVTGFKFIGGSITGDIASDEFKTVGENYSANIGIAVSSGASAEISGGSIIKGVFTPIYASSADVTIDGISFESGIQIDTISDKTVVKNCTDTDGGYRAKVDIMAGAGDDEAMKNKLEEFVNDNGNENVFITLKSADTDNILSSYLTNARFASKRLFNRLFKIGTNDTFKTSDPVFEGTDATSITFNDVVLSDYVYGGTSTNPTDETVSGTVDIVLNGSAKGSQFIATSVTFSSDEGIVLENGEPALVYVGPFSFEVEIGNDGLSIPYTDTTLNYTETCYNDNKLTAPAEIPTGVSVNGWLVK